MVHLGGMCVSLHDGWRAFLGEALSVLLSAGLAQPRRRRCGEDSVSTLVTDASIITCMHTLHVLSQLSLHRTNKTNMTYLSYSKIRYYWRIVYVAGLQDVVL